MLLFYNRIINNYKFYLLILMLVLIVNTFFGFTWGYDEFGAINTHLELDDKDYINIYKSYLAVLGVNNPGTVDFIMSYILPIIIVPLRWTYALGISPILGLSRMISVDWPLIGSLMLIPNIALSAVGGYLVAKTLFEKNQSSNIFIIFILVLLLSHPFLKWTLTLTSYSYHLFCFGLLLYSEVVLKHRNNNLFGGASITRSVVQVFNYQYIVIVAMFGLLEFMKNPKKFFKQGAYLSWIIPAITAGLSIIFLVVRASISGQHNNPTFASVGGQEIEKFDFLSNTESLVSAIEFFFNRLVDFVYYFFFEFSGYYNTLNYSDFSIYFILPVLLTAIVLYFNAFKKNNSNLKRVLFVFIASLMLPYLIGIQPMTPSRHSLVLLMPFILILSFVVSYLLTFIPNSKVKKIGLLFLLCVSTIQAIGFNQHKQKELVISEVIPILENYKIQHIVLNRCDLRPTLYKNISKNRVIYYRCGSVVARTIPAEVRQVSILSEKKISIQQAKEIMTSYSNKQWKLSNLSIVENPCKNENCSVNFIVLNAY